MKISVIIPVYNVEKYLEQCVKSVLEQTYRDFEIILVDDGSKDSSGKMCDQLAEQDERIRVIHKENGGLSDARNRGIQEAAGDYLMFLDSDDYWDTKKCLQEIVRNLEVYRPDMLTFRYKKYIESEDIYLNCLPSADEQEINELNAKDKILKALIAKGLYLSSACNKVMRTEFARKNELYFQRGITSEDIDWCARCMLNLDSIVYSNLDCYVYRQRNNSISHDLSYKNINDLKNNIVRCVELGEGLEKSEALYDIYFTFVAYQYGAFLCSNHYVKDPRVKTLVNEMKSYRWLLAFHSNKKVKMQYLIDRFLGYENLNRCMKLYAKIRKG